MAMNTVYKYLVCGNDLTESMKAAYRTQAAEAGLKRAMITRVVTSREEALVRHPEPVIDFGMAVGGWLAPAFAAVGTDYTVFNAVANPQLANNRVVVFYGCFIETIPNPAYLLTFREGAAGGSTYAMFELEEMNVRQETVGYFSEPVYYDPQRVLEVEWRARAIVGAGSHMGLLGFIVEPRGPVISA
jgi:hypothetical protein